MKNKDIRVMTIIGIVVTLALGTLGFNLGGTITGILIFVIGAVFLIAYDIITIKRISETNARNVSNFRKRYLAGNYKGLPNINN